jgi:hypothetical protein
MFDERCDLGLKVTGQEVVSQQDAVLEGLAPALDLALGLGMAGYRAPLLGCRLDWTVTNDNIA